MKFEKTLAVLTLLVLCLSLCSCQTPARLEGIGSKIGAAVGVRATGEEIQLYLRYRDLWQSTQPEPELVEIQK